MALGFGSLSELAIGSPKGVKSNVTIALTGVTCSATIGSITVSETKVISGNTASIGAGTLYVNTSLSNNGNGVNAAIGSSPPSLSFTLSGNTSSASIGNVTTSKTASVSGNTISATNGSLLPVLSIVSPNVSSLATVGSISSSILLPLYSVTSSGTVGTISATESISTSISGNSVSANVGSATASQLDSKSISGNSVSVNIGSVTASQTNTIQISGNNASGNIGVIGYAIPLLGNTAGATSGTIISNIQKSISGNNASGNVGNITLFVTLSQVPSISTISTFQYYEFEPIDLTVTVTYINPDTLLTEVVNITSVSVGYTSDPDTFPFSLPNATFLNNTWSINGMVPEVFMRRVTYIPVNFAPAVIVNRFQNLPAKYDAITKYVGPANQFTIVNVNANWVSDTSSGTIVTPLKIYHNFTWSNQHLKLSVIGGNY